MPYPSLYLDSDPVSEKIRSEYLNFLTTVFTLIGEEEFASDYAAEAFNLERAIASYTKNPDELVRSPEHPRLTWPPTWFRLPLLHALMQQIDPFETYNPMPLEDFKRQLTPDLPWESFLGIVGLSNYSGNVTVSVPSYFRKLSVHIPSLSRRQKIAYLASAPSVVPLPRPLTAAGRGS